MNDKTAPVAITDEEAAFESWWITIPVSEFTGVTANHVWMAWQARAALSSASPADKPVATRKAYICTSCECVYADQTVSQCDCMPDVQAFTEGVIIYPAAPVSPSPQQSESAAQQAAVPEGWRERLNEMRDADYTYSQHPELARVVFDSVIDALDELEAATPSLQQKEAALPAPMPVAAFWYDPETSVERRRMTEYADQIVITGCNIRWGNYTTPFYAAPIPLQEPKPVAPELLEQIATLQSEARQIKAELKQSNWPLGPLIAQALPEAKDVERSATWQRITKPGQVKVGDKLRFTIGDEKYSEAAKIILHPGTNKEEIIYNKRQNYYLITSMAIANKGSQKNVEFFAAIDAAIAATRKDQEK